MDPATIIGSKLIAEATGLALKKSGHSALGRPQERALGKAVAQSVGAVIGRHPEIAAISAEIDVVDTDVVREIVAVASGAAPTGWEVAHARWATLYETEAPATLDSFLTDLADELGRRLRGDPELQPLFVVNAADVIVARTDALQSGIDVLDTKLDAIVDPVASVRLRGDAVGRDLGLASNIIGQVGAEMARGPLRALDVDVSLREAGTSFRLSPRRGSDLRVNVTSKPPESPEDRRRLDEIMAAMQRGDAFEIPDADVVFEAGGVPMKLPGRVTASAGPTVARHRAVIEFRGGRLPAERFLVDLWIRAVDGHIRGESPPETRSLLRVSFEDAGGGAARFRFNGNPDVATVATQVKLARLCRHLKRGAKVTIWFVEMDFERSVTLPPDSTYDSADADHEVLKLFEEVQRRVGAEVAQVEQLTPADVSDLRMAKRLLDRGRATLPGRGGTFTTTTGDDIRANVPASQVKNGRVALITREPEWTLQLTTHPLPIGPVQTRFSVFWPPKSVRQRAGGDYVSDMEIDPSRPVVLERLADSERPDKSVTEMDVRLAPDGVKAAANDRTDAA
jgi:hypothetical protein